MSLAVEETTVTKTLQERLTESVQERLAMDRVAKELDAKREAMSKQIRKLAVEAGVVQKASEWSPAVGSFRCAGCLVEFTSNVYGAKDGVEVRQITAIPEV